MNHIKHVYDQRLRSDPLGGHLGWVKRLKFNFFSEHGHVECQIKGNKVCSDVEANILAAVPPSP